MALIAAFNTYPNDAVASGTDIEADLAKIRAEVDGNLEAANLANLAVTTAKLATEAVTAAKLATDAVTTAKILDSAVTSPKIANGAVTNAKIPIGGLNGDRFATATHALGTGADGTKAGMIKGLYRSITFTQAADTVQTFDHDLGTTQLIGFILLNATYASAPGEGVQYYAFAANGSNQFDLKSSYGHGSNNATLLVLILYY